MAKAMQIMKQLEIICTRRCSYLSVSKNRKNETKMGKTTCRVENPCKYNDLSIEETKITPTRLEGSTEVT